MPAADNMRGDLTIPADARVKLTSKGLRTQERDARREGLGLLLNWISDAENTAMRLARAEAARKWLEANSAQVYGENGLGYIDFTPEMVTASIQDAGSRARDESSPEEPLETPNNIATTNSPGLNPSAPASGSPPASSSTGAPGTTTAPGGGTPTGSPGGGGSIPAASSPSGTTNDGGPGPDATDEELEAYIRENYGYMAWALDHEELGPLLRLAIKERWTEQKLTAELRTTDWWRTNEASARNFDRLLGEDPASVEADIKTMELEVKLAASQLGIKLTPERQRQLATDAIRYNWAPNGNEFRNAIISEASYNHEQGIAAGDIGATQLKYRMKAKEYFVDISDEKAWEWALKVQEGTATEHDFDVYLKQIALSRFPQLKSYLDMGITPEMFFEPYKQTIGSMLEIPPSTIDMAKDPRFAPILDWKEEDGTNRPMKLSELGDYIRRLPDWENTSQAEQQASELTKSLLETFGAI